MSDTPRTDAEFEKWLDSTQPYTDLAIFTRQLERELNEARKIASKYDDLYFATRELLTVSTERADRLERELNEANHRIGKLERRLDEARHHIRGLTNERDSARIESSRSWKLRGEFKELLGTDDVAVGTANVQHMKRNADRYEVVRKMNASQFSELLQRCLFQDLRFDDEVDRLAAIKMVKMHLKVKEDAR